MIIERSYFYTVDVCQILTFTICKQPVTDILQLNPPLTSQHLPESLPPPFFGRNWLPSFWHLSPGVKKIHFLHP